MQSESKIRGENAMTDSNINNNSLTINKPEQAQSSRPRSMLELIRSKMSGGSESKYDEII